MGNLDFSNNAGFSWYCVALVVVGVGLIVTTALTKTRTAGLVTGVLVGAAMVLYGVYLAFIFQGGTYYVSYYVIAAPAIFMLALIRAARRKKTGTPVANPGQARKVRRTAAAAAGPARAAADVTTATGQSADPAAPKL